MEKERIVYLDYLRVLSAVFVVFLHMAAECWNQPPVDSLFWQTMNFYDSISRWCVPVFVMISGTLFLSRDIDIKQLFTKYILRLAVAYLLWSIFYNTMPYVASLLKGQLTPFRPLLFVKQVLAGYNHLWFLPMLMGVYLAVPIFREVVRSPKVTRYYLAVSFAVTFLLPSALTLASDFFDGRIAAAAKSLMSIPDFFHLEVFSGYCFYFVLGYHLSQTVLSPRRRRLCLGLGAAGILLTAVLNSAVSLKTGTPQLIYFTNFSVFVAAGAVAVYVLFQYADYPHPRLNRLIVRLSGYTMGVYLGHIFLFQVFCKLGFGVTSFQPVLSIPVLTVLIAALSFLCSAVLSRIPLLRKWLV